MHWFVIFMMGFLETVTQSTSLDVRGNELTNGKIDSFGISSAENCLYRCTCPSTGKECSSCQECPRQVGEPCSNERPCDLQKGLVCNCQHGDNEGICRESEGLPCIVYDKIYSHGKTFHLDCRTQCVCQNGTYGCSSLCPQEHISPQGSCQHPRLVEVSGQCCREWICDSRTVEEPSACSPTFSKWSPCSSDCGAGMSTRQSNINAACQSITETRLCQYRRCQSSPPKGYHHVHHHLRKSHECKATHRLSTAVYLRVGPCRSRKRYRPKYCGSCPYAGMTCQPSLSTTVKMELVCEEAGLPEVLGDLPLEFYEPGSDLWSAVDEDFQSPVNGSASSVALLTQWILKCDCLLNPTEAAPMDNVILHRVHRTASP